MLERRRRFQFCIERFQNLRRLFLQLPKTGISVILEARLPEPRTVSHRTRSSGSEASETIPFPGADSIFSSCCGAISRRLPFLPSSPLAPRSRQTETPRFKRSTIGSAVSAGTALRVTQLFSDPAGFRRKRPHNPARIGGGLRDPKTTLARIVFPRKKNHTKNPRPPVSGENRTRAARPPAKRAPQRTLLSPP